MQDWRRSFLDKLGQVQNQWHRRFEETLDGVIGQVFDDFAAFLRTNGFHVSTPLRQDGRRSYKFELAENAYLLLIFRSTAIGEFETRCECFVPGRDPVLTKSLGRVVDVDEAWTRNQFQSALDSFVEQLGGSGGNVNVTMPRAESEELVEV